ncbi:helix-turn-helix domain-containing protein [Deinococcus oregonensis]|uniref:Helix-turn-helix domain-containing protein n=1 Tax=Deinococcus oregonensis TaxID=1805970 RepID=A0ABV6B5X0_9DEIO
MREAQIMLGERIKQLREGRGWSQDTFAHLAGLNRAYPHRLETAKVDMRFTTLLKIARVFGLSPTELLQFDDVGQRPKEQLSEQ